MCFVCGPENPAGFKLRFTHPKPGHLESTVVFKKEHQGYKNIAHGGLVSALLDEMVVNLAWMEGKPVVTAEITVRLKKPTKVGEKIRLEGRIDREKGKVLVGTATAKNTRGELLADATVTCVRIPGAVN